MYQPSHFREDRLEVQHELIRTHPLGLIIIADDQHPRSVPCHLFKKIFFRRVEVLVLIENKKLMPIYLWIFGHSPRSSRKRSTGADELSARTR